LEKTPPEYSDGHVADAAPPASSSLQEKSFNGRYAYSSQVIGVERRGSGNTVFQADDSIFISAAPRPTHWSVAWSDLMMTMFVLFLSMFAYQVANEQFLKEGGQEIIGGDTTEALRTLEPGTAALPFPRIAPGLPLVTAGKIKMIDPVPAPPDKTPPPVPVPPEPEIIRIPGTITVIEQAPVKASNLPETVALLGDKNEPQSTRPSNKGLNTPADTILAPKPLVPERPQAPVLKESFKELYTLSQNALESNRLEKFASIDLVPDKTVRIILTGDLLFDLGESDLTPRAKSSLHKIVNVIKSTPYMINVVGHTDNIPMASARFKSNWELSVARASTVTRFLIDEIGMNPAQFVVSGFSSYRPTVPNNTVSNRAKNRRVEIIISKRLPAPKPATDNNLN